MKRITLDDGRWFDREKAHQWVEGTWHDGRNFISLATNDQWDHETLFRTTGGKWILYQWSDRQGSDESWFEIDNDRAARWLVKNKYDAHPACTTEYQALEVR